MDKTILTINSFLEKLRTGEKSFSEMILQNADFTGMNLEKINFSNSDLSNSNFSSANLSEANFSEANLARCQFKGAILRGANFEKANLEWAVFTGAIFENTSLERANLMWAHLCKSDLMRANIRDAIINWACLADSKLSVEQMANIPSGSIETITFKYDVTQPGAKGVYGPGGNSSLAGYGAGKLIGGYLGQTQQEGESEHDKAEKQAFYGKPQTEAAQGYGIVRREEAGPKAEIRRLRPLK